MACRQYVLAATANGNSGVLSFPRVLDRTGIYQVAITGTATVSLQGRIDSNAPWIDILDSTASDAKVIALFPQMQISYTISSGTVSAWIMD